MAGVTLRNSGAEIEPLTLDETVTDAEEARLLHEHIVVYRLDGALFFGAAQWFLTELTAVSDVRIVILRLSQMHVLDATGAQALGEIVDELESRGFTVASKVYSHATNGSSSRCPLDHLAHERQLSTPRRRCQPRPAPPRQLLELARSPAACTRSRRSSRLVVCKPRSGRALASAL